MIGRLSDVSDASGRNARLRGRFRGLAIARCSSLPPVDGTASLSDQPSRHTVEVPFDEPPSVIGQRAGMAEAQAQQRLATATELAQLQHALSENPDMDEIRKRIDGLIQRISARPG